MVRAALLRNHPVIGYRRKSKEQQDAQIHSLERQTEQITEFATQKTLGQVDWWFEDEQSGKNFNRPGYEALLQFCEQHPQPKAAPGRILCLDYDRFSRSVDETFKVNTIELQRQVIRLYDAGWELDFVMTPKSGNNMLDGLIGSFKSTMAGEYIEKLSKTSRSGQRKTGRNGNWLGGPAPFPAMRYNEDDPDHKRPLYYTDRARNGKAVLGPNTDHPEYRTYWEEGAKMLLRGSSLSDVARQYTQWGIPLYYNRGPELPNLGWSNVQISQIYSNRALIGAVEYTFRLDDDSVEKFLGTAKWQPLVDVALFERVQAEIARRSVRRKKRATPRVDYLLDLVCAHCHTPYVCATREAKWLEKDGIWRRYTHPAAGARISEERKARILEAGCKHWYVDADAAEQLIYKLIEEHRASGDFVAELAVKIDANDQRGTDYEPFLVAMRTKVRTLTAERDRLKRALRIVDDDDALMGELVADIRSVGHEIEALNTQITDTQNTAAATQADGRVLLDILDQTKELLSTWHVPGTIGLEARKGLIDLWVNRVFVEVQADPKKPRSATRVLHVYLNTDPTNPVQLYLTPDYKHRAQRFNKKPTDTELAYADEFIQHLDRMGSQEIIQTMCNYKSLQQFSLVVKRQRKPRSDRKTVVRQA